MTKSTIAFLLLGACLTAAACQEGAAFVPCRNIPEGGCPRSGSACLDPSCAALYACTEDGTWRLTHTCPERDAGAEDDARAPDEADAPPTDASFVDVPGAGGGPGCTDLVVPDCSLALASACGAGCCGCEDVFVCRGGGWELWGFCDPDRGLLSSP